MGVAPRWRPTASTAAQRTNRLALFGDVARDATWVSDSRWRGVSPAHEHSWAAPAKRVHVADLGHEHRGQDRADPADGLDGLVTGMIARGTSAITAAKTSTSVVEGVDQAAAASRPGAGRRRPTDTSSSSDAPAEPEQVGDRHCSRPLWPARRGPEPSGRSGSPPAWPGGGPAPAVHATRGGDVGLGQASQA